jgi:hypothetical protein
MVFHSSDIRRMARSGGPTGRQMASGAEEIRAMTVYEATLALIEARNRHREVQARVEALQHDFATRYTALLQEEAQRQQDVAEAEATLRELILEESLLQQPLWSLYFMLTDPARYRGWSHPRGDQT